MKKGMDREYVEHYVMLMSPVLKRLKKLVEKEGPDKGLWGMFEDTPSYQLFERIDEKQGERSFPCPYKGALENCKKWMRAEDFFFEWQDVHEKWCIPIWTGFAKEIGIKIIVQPGDMCTVKLA
jgi:hypothetical protein